VPRSRTIIEIVNRLTLVAGAVGLSLVALAGCKRDIQNTDAVRQGVLAYLSKRSDLLSMDVSVTNVVYGDKEATATVHLQAKGSTAPGSGMDMRYVLERKGNDWVVKGRAGGEAHGQGMGAAPGAPPPDGSPGSIGAMPQTLPPGHPAIPSKKPEPTQ
jgi:hypothetical protein